MKKELYKRIVAGCGALVVLSSIGATNNHAYAIENNNESSTIDKDKFSFGTIVPMKKYFEEGTHSLTYSYTRSKDSEARSDIEEPEGYMKVSEVEEEKVFGGKEYIITTITYINFIDVEAIGTYDAIKNEIVFPNAGTPVESLKLTL